MAASRTAGNQGFCHLSLVVRMPSPRLEGVAVLGNLPALGSWESPVPLVAIDGGARWKLPEPVAVPRGASIQYRYAFTEGGRLSEYEPIDADRRLIATSRRVTIEDTFGDAEEDEEVEEVEEAHGAAGTQPTGRDGALQPPAGSAFAAPQQQTTAADAAVPAIPALSPAVATHPAPHQDNHAAPSVASRAARRAMRAGLAVPPLNCGSPLPDSAPEHQPLAEQAPAGAAAPSQSDSDSHSQSQSLGHIRVPPSSNPMRAIQAAARALPSASRRRSPGGVAPHSPASISAAKEGVITGSMVYHEIIPAVLGSLMRRRRMVCVTLSLPVILRKLPCAPGGAPRWTAVFDPDDFLARGTSRSVADTVEVVWVGFVTRECMDRVTASEAPRRSSVASTDSDRRRAGVAPGSPPAVGLSARPLTATAEADPSASSVWKAVDQAVEAHLGAPAGAVHAPDTAALDASGLNLGLVDSLDREPQVDDLVVPLAAADRKAIREALEGISCVPIFLEDMAHMESARRASAAAVAATAGGRGHRAGGTSADSSAVHVAAAAAAAKAAAAATATPAAAAGEAAASTVAAASSRPPVVVGASSDRPGHHLQQQQQEQQHQHQQQRPPPIRPTVATGSSAAGRAGTPASAHDGDDEVALVAGIDTPADKAGAYQLPSGTVGPEPVGSPSAADDAGAMGPGRTLGPRGGWTQLSAGTDPASDEHRSHARHGTADSEASRSSAPAGSGHHSHGSVPVADAILQGKPVSASEGGTPPSSASHRRVSSVAAPTDCEPSAASMAHALRLMRRFAAYLSMVIGPNLHNVQEVGDLPSLMSFGASFLAEAAAGANGDAQPPAKRARSPGAPFAPPAHHAPRPSPARTPLSASPSTGRTAGLPRTGPEVAADSPATEATRRAGFGRLHVDAVLAVAQRGWKAYRRVNEGFARVIMEVYKEGDVVWTHDYWLCLLPAYLSHLCNPAPSLIFFMHAPFPTSEIFRTLGNREELVRGMLAADVVGFHTFNHARHFLQVCKRVLGIPFSSREGGRIGLDIGGRDVSVTISHVGVEPEELDKLMASEEAAAYARDLRRRHPDRVIIAGMDSAGRLQGIALKLLAFERLLEQNQQLAHAVVLVQCVETRPIAMHSDSAMNKRELGQLVRRINERFGPVVDLIEAVSFGPSFRVGLFHSADVLFQTPVREGLSLMPLEYIFVRTRWQLRRSAALYGTSADDVADGNGSAPASPATPGSLTGKAEDDVAADEGEADRDLDASSFVLEPSAAVNFPGGNAALTGLATGASAARSMREPPKRGHTRRSSDPSSLPRDSFAPPAHVSAAEARETLLSNTRHRHDTVIPPGSPVNILGEMPAHYATIAAPRDGSSQGAPGSASVDALLGRDGRTPAGQPSAQASAAQSGSRRVAVAGPARPAGVSGMLDAAVPEEDDDDDEDATAQERRARTRGTPGMPPAPGYWSPASPSMGPSSDSSPRPRADSGSPVLGAGKPPRGGAPIASRGIAAVAGRRTSDLVGRPSYSGGRSTTTSMAGAGTRGSPRLAPARGSPLAGPTPVGSAADGTASVLRHSASLPFLPRVRSFAHVLVPNIPDVEALTAPLPPPDRGGCVVLSEFSTASHILNSTLRVNPFHVDDTAKTLAKAIGMEDSERSHRQWRDYHYAKRNPSAHWSRRVLTELLTVEAEAATGSGTFTELEPSVSTKNAFSVPAQLGRRGAGASCSHLVTDAVAESFSAAGRRVLFVDYGGTLIAREGSGMYVKHEFLGQSHSARTLPHEVLRDLARIAADPASTVVVLVGLNISNGDAAALASIPNLTIALENSAVVSWGARDKMRLSGLVKGRPVGAEGIAVNVNTAIFAGREWVRLPESAQFLEGDLSAEWREAVAVARSRMDEYRWRVNGSTVRETGAMLSWDYSNADPEWGKQQAGRLVDDLRTMLTSPNVSVGRRRVMVEVSPAGVTKGTLAERILASLTATESATTFALAVGDDSSDEDMFKAVHSFVVRATAHSVPGPLDPDADGDSMAGPTPDTGSSSPAPNTSSSPDTDAADPLHAATAAAAASAPAQGVRVYSVCVGRKHSSARYFLGNVKEVRSLIAELAATF